MTQCYNLDVWFLEAQRRYQKLQEKVTKTIDDKEKKEKQCYLDELKTELELLDGLEGESLESFIDFVFTQFPPKHRKKAVKPVIKDGQEKKTLITLSALYHPDKVNEKEHGQKYKVLCEEIVKRINKRLGRYKC